MSDETKQLIVYAAVVIGQAYLTDPERFPIFAHFWHWIARVTGYLANMLGRISVQARYNYWTVVNHGS
jgi:hypothetical protein